jgi:hypothetical protein
MVEKPEKPTKPASPTGKAKRAYVTQSNLPGRSLREALRVPQAITDNYAAGATAPHDVAMALELSPTSTSWRDLAAASLGYGLTKGSWNADRITLDVLGKRVTAPTVEGDDVRARAEAALRPKVMKAKNDTNSSIRRRGTSIVFSGARCPRICRSSGRSSSGSR